MSKKQDGKSKRADGTKKANGHYWELDYELVLERTDTTSFNSVNQIFGSTSKTSVKKDKESGDKEK